MNKALILSSILMAGALSGCSSLHTSTTSLPIAGTVSSDVQADIEVGEKISGESSATRILFFTLSQDSEYADGITYGAPTATGTSLPFGLSMDPVGKVKAAAAYNAVESSGADVIVAPRYVVKQKDYTVFGIINVTVEGYKGTIKSID